MHRLRGAVALAVVAAALLAPQPSQAEEVAASATYAPPDIVRAQLSPRRFTTLSAELGARIERIGAREGERFRDGQALVVLNCSVQRAALERAQAALGGAEKSRAVNEKLHTMNAGGALEADLAAAEAAKARAEVVGNQALLSKCQISAPFGGRVSELKVREQQFVQPGTSLMEIIDDSVLEVEFLAPSRWLMWLKSGHTFSVVVDETGKTYPGKIARLGAKVDPVSQSIKVVGEVSGHFPELLAGMSGNVIMPLQK